MKKYHQGILVCDDPGCSIKTTQQSVLGDNCPARGCMGRLKLKYPEAALYTQLKYFDAIFDLDHACTQLGGSEINQESRRDFKREVAPRDKETLSRLRERTQNYLRRSAYNFVEPNVWATLFGQVRNKATVQ